MHSRAHTICHTHTYGMYIIHIHIHTYSRTSQHMCVYAHHIRTYIFQHVVHTGMHMPYIFTLHAYDPDICTAAHIYRYAHTIHIHAINIHITSHTYGHAYIYTTHTYAQHIHYAYTHAIQICHAPYTCRYACYTQFACYAPYTCIMHIRV